MYLVRSSNFRVCAWNPMVLGHFNENSSAACVACAWKLGAQEKTGAREGDTRDTPCVSPSRAPVLSFALYFRAPATQANSSVVLSHCIIYSVRSSNSLSLWTNPVVWLHVLRKPLQHHLRFKILRTQGRISWIHFFIKNLFWGNLQMESSLFLELKRNASRL